MAVVAQQQVFVSLLELAMGVRVGQDVSSRFQWVIAETPDFIQLLHYFVIQASNLKRVKIRKI